MRLYRISKCIQLNKKKLFFVKKSILIGNVEDWMCEIERVMRETLRQVIRDALEDYTWR